MPPTPPTTPPTIEIGHVIGEKYRVEAVIGTGGMGVVLAARHIAMNSRVAIKVLKLDEDVDPVEAVSRFQREARAAARIQSEHVVRVTDVAALPDGTPYMVMEYLEGHDLRRVIQERRQLPIAEAVDYALQACEGLAEAHAAGVIHRDLKPSNLFLARRANGTTILKVLDFGISKVAPRADEVAMTTTTSLMGSPLYMAPEQMRSSRSVDARADVWSLGLILYEMIAGDLPFGGATIPEICVAVMHEEPAAISQHRQDVPQELQAILLKCLEKKREDRYASTAALARELTRFASERSSVHADRASAALKAERPTMETLPELPTVGAGGSGGRRVVSPDAPTQPPQTAARRDPETQPSWAGRRERRASRRRGAWLALGAIAVVLGAVAVTGTVMKARAPESTGLASSGGPAPTFTTTRALDVPPPPPADDLASVPIDSIPLAARDGGSAHAVRPPPPHAAPPPSATHPAAKDDWKWGDRN